MQRDCSGGPNEPAMASGPQTAECDPMQLRCSRFHCWSYTLYTSISNTSGITVSDVCWREVLSILRHKTRRCGRQSNTAAFRKLPAGYDSCGTAGIVTMPGCAARGMMHIKAGCHSVVDDTGFGKDAEALIVADRALSELWTQFCSCCAPHSRSCLDAAHCVLPHLSMTQSWPTM